MDTEIVALSPLTLVLVLLFGFCAWVFMYAPVKYAVRWALIPLALLAAVCSAQIYDARLGYAVPDTLPEKFVYLGHHVVVVHGMKVGIEVWAQTRSTRLYRIQYSKAAERAMEQAKAVGGNGGVIVMHKGNGKNGDGEEADPYESNILLPSDINPKP